MRCWRWPTKTSAKPALDNVEFLKGEIENIPLPDNSVDVIISNCVINLSADKDRVLREAFRVLKPGGRFAVSDVVTRGEIAPEIRQSMLLWVGCIAGALDEDEYRAKLTAAGFEHVEHRADPHLSRRRRPRVPAPKALDVDAMAPQVDGKFMSAFVRAVKPLAGSSTGSRSSRNQCMLWPDLLRQLGEKELRQKKVTEEI